MKQVMHNVNKAVTTLVLCCVLQSVGTSTSLANDDQPFAPMNPLPFRDTPYHWQSGQFGGSLDGKPVAQHTITSSGATWLRLSFGDVTLGEHSYLTITSLLDGASQKLTAATLNTSGKKSAYFNGDSVVIKLFAGGRDRGVGIEVKSLEAGERSFGPHSICGSTDDRIASSNKAAGRLSNGCTGWIIGNGKLITAGHCAGNMSVVEFNVPMSSSNGQLQHPGPEHQYTVNATSVTFQNGGQGNDWAVFSVFNNSQTGLSPIQAQGSSFNVAQDTPGSTIRITGYGTDSGSTNQIQQTHSGALTSYTSSRLLYSVDTTGGNSGSPIIDAATGTALGVHTHGGCSSSGGSNSGTRATLAGFWTAINQGSGSGQVKLFKHCNYGGWTAAFGEGSYRLVDIVARGGLNDDTSSVQIPSGYNVTLYQHDNFQGSSITLSGNDTCLVNDGFNDTVSSLIVRRN